MSDKMSAALAAGNETDVRAVRPRPAEREPCIMKITNLIKMLGGREPDGYPFLSVYLNAESNSTGREDYQVWLKKSLSEQARTYKENPEEAERFENAVRKINDFVGGADVASNGIAIFASLGDGSIFETVELDVPFRQNRFFAYDRPYIFPLARAVYQHPRYAVLWADTNKADIYIFDGEDRIRTDNRANEKVENIQNVVTNRTQVGGWSQGRFQRHIDNFHLHHAKEVVGELETLIREKGIDKLVLCGDEAAIMPVLRPQLSKAVEEKVIAVINLSQYDSPEEIRKRTLKRSMTSRTRLVRPPEWERSGSPTLLPRLRMGRSRNLSSAPISTRSNTARTRSKLYWNTTGRATRPHRSGRRRWFDLPAR